MGCDVMAGNEDSHFSLTVGVCPRLRGPAVLRFAQSYRVIAMDVRGHRHSAKPPGPYTVELFMQDAIALLRALDAMPAHIVGLSMGGMIAFQMAVDSPEAVRSLVIVNSGPAMILRTFSQKMLIRSRFAVVRLFGMRALGRMVAGPLFPKPEQAQLRQRFMAQIGMLAGIQYALGDLKADDSPSTK